MRATIEQQRLAKGSRYVLHRGSPGITPLDQEVPDAFEDPIQARLSKDLLGQVYIYRRLRSRCVEISKSTKEICEGDQMLLLRWVIVNRSDPLLRRPTPEAPTTAVHLSEQIENKKRSDGGTELRVAKQVFYRLN